ncbi:MAG: cytochrome c [Bacteroidota bacterium]
MRIYFSLVLIWLVAVACRPGQVTDQERQASWPKSFGFGRPASTAEIDSIDFDIRPDGLGLPPGSGTFASGRKIFATKCSRCHGANGVDGPFGSLTGDDKSIGKYWPYATTVYDYIYRAMPYDQPGSLTTDEVYDLTAFVLTINGLVDSTKVVDAASLPLVNMPAQKLYVSDDRTGGPVIR